VRTRTTWLAVALGGALGSLTRAVLDLPALTTGDINLWTILLVNLVGAGLLGFVTGHGTPSWPVPIRAGVTTGFLGSFTTFSAIMTGWLSLTLFPDPLLGVVYIAATLIAGVFSAYGGIEAGSWWRDVSAPKAAP
jgi:CrcB protein